MNSDSKNHFLHLNRDNSWPDFQWQGLELRVDGALQLYALPLLEDQLPQEVTSLGVPGGPAGIAVDIDGTIYFSDPQNHRILKIDACDGAQTALPCIGNEGLDPTRLSTPRGLLIPSHRRSLFVADSGNHRIQIFDLTSFQLVDIWGQTSSAGTPQPGGEPGRFNTPWALAGDREGGTYVVDYGNHRVQKFNALGELVPGFWERMRGEQSVNQPIDIAVATEGQAIRIYVIDGGTRTIGVFDAEGHRVGLIASERLSQPLGIAAADGALYVGDDDSWRVLAFKRKAEAYDLAGEAVGYVGPVAALAFDGKGSLLVHTGSALAPVRLALNKGHRAKGVLWSKPIQAPKPEVQWHRLRAAMERLPPDAHIQLFVHVSNNAAAAPLAVPGADDPFGDPRWRAVTPDVADLFIGGAGCCLWVGALFSSDGRATPVVSQIRAEFDRDTYLSHLPAIYNNDPRCRDFLLRFLSLFEGFFGEVDGEILDLPALFDPDAVPLDWLPWLAGWLALELDEDWDEAMQRHVIAEVFKMYGKRGTAEGLRQALRLFARVHAIIQEPILNAAWWSLPAHEETKCNACEDVTDKSWQGTENSILGFTTMLASAEAQGAVVGTTAILDQSHLIPAEEFGAPLFTDVVHQFSVLTYRGELKCHETLVRVRAVIEREKPAHTHYHLCIVEPRMRVGFQARVGIDAVVAGPPPAVKLGEVPGFGPYLALGGRPPARLGDQSRVGLTARIG